jgi:hypothetical protein
VSSRPNRSRRRAIRRAIRRRARAITRRIHRAARRRLRRVTKTLALRRTRRLARRAERRQATHHAYAQAGPLAPRSITGTARPARNGPAPAPRATAAARPAAPMKQRVKRTKDGKFNGSNSSGKKTAAKKTTKTALSPEARKAAATRRLLTAGNKRVARIDKRTDAADQRIDRMFWP